MLMMGITRSSDFRAPDKDELNQDDPHFLVNWS